MNTNNYLKKHRLSRLILGLAIIMLTAWGYTAQAQVSVTATAGTTGPTVYTDVNSAFAAINAGTHQGAVLITVTANTTEPAPATQLVSSGTGSALYQSVKIVPQGDVVINSAATPTSSRGILEFIGADSITIDGDDPLTPGTQNLTIQMATTSNASTACLRFSSSSSTANGCLNVTVKNCKIIGGRNSATTTTTSYGIFSGLSTAASTITTASGSASSRNMHIENNTITRAYTGIYCYGITAYPMDSLVIKNNTLGSATSADNIGFRGILTANTATTAGTTSAQIIGNDIRLGDYGSTGFSASISAIDLPTSNAGALVSGNNIHDVNQPSTGGYGAYGIFLSNATNNSGIQIYNNMIRDVKMYWYQTSYTSTFMPVGIFISTAVTNVKVNNNTVVMPLQLASSSAYSSFCFLASSSTMTISEFQNNLFVNTHVSTSAVAVSINSATNIASATMNRNSYYTAGANMAYYSGSLRSTMSVWRTATSKDANSVNHNPSFVSATDLHLTAGIQTPLESNGATVAAVTTDFDGNVRPGPAGSVNGGALGYDIGADEADQIPFLTNTDSIMVDQVVAFIAPGSTNKAIVGMRVFVSGYVGSQTLTNIYLSTAGTTAPSDILAANVYYTGTSSTFSTATPFGTTVSTPGSAFSVSGTQVLPVGTSYFWVAYDISGSAADGNLADAVLDSMTINGATKLPINGNPAGSTTISLPITYVSSATTQPVTSRIEKSSVSNRILGIQVVTSATGSPADLTSFDIATTGTDSLPDIANLKIWYTGTSSTFAMTTQFGSTVASPAATQTVTGVQTLTNGTNYFWVTYDITSVSTVGHHVDGECTSLTFGTSYVPSVTAPAGNREIKAAYCSASATNTSDEEIGSVTFGSLTNTAACATLAPGAGSIADRYSNYTTIAAPSIAIGSTVPLSLTLVECGTGTYTSSVAVYIDYNQDGDFTDADETIYTSANFTGVLAGNGGIIKSGNIAIPCTALLGETKMRVVYGEQATAPASCGTVSWGEVEDYFVNIVDNPIAYVSSTAIQNTGVVAPNTMDAQILRIPVIAQGCGVGTLTDMTFSTTGTTAPADITSAKLYATGNSTSFSTVKLLGTVASPSGTFSFTALTDTLLSATGDTNNYWLAYDIASGATLSNVVDATFDGITAVGGAHVPSVTAPAGTRMIDAPMTYVSSTVSQASSSSVAKGSTDNKIVMYQVVTSAIGSPINVTSFDIATTGTDSLPDITNLKVYYTGASSTFATTNQFGSTVATPAATQAVPGTQALLNGNNYFWVTYDISAAATIGHVVDAEITSATLGVTPQVPTVTAPGGTRLIRNPYCASAPMYTTYDDIGSVVFNQNASPVLSHGGCSPTYSNPSAGQGYNDYSALPAANMQVSNPVSFSICAVSDNTFFVGCYLAVFIDYNQNGTWDAGEMAYSSSVPTGTAITYTGNFTIPCDALTGETRMRVTLVGYSLPSLASACYSASTNYYYGETEDYTINITPNPIGYVSSTATQDAAIAAPGTADAQILRVPVKAFGCGVGVLNNMHFSTTGTTSASDIVSAKLYKTGNSAVFNITNLLGTVSAPSGAFSFTLADTLLGGLADTNNYWLAYEVASGATLSNVIDATFDSLNAVGAYHIPTASNPAGSTQIVAPMTYMSSAAAQTNTSKVETNSTNNNIVRLEVVTSPTGSPINVTSMDISTAGTDSLPDIANLKVWYTGNSSTFATTIQFGSTVATPAATQSVTGAQPLATGNNYFWVTYDVVTAATIGHNVDGEITSVTVAGTPQTPSVTAPAGVRQIRAPYCTAAATNTSDEEIASVNFGSLSNSAACATLAPGAGSVADKYSNYTTLTPTNILRGTSVPLSLTLVECGGGTYTSSVGVYIDYNGDGDFTDAGELVYSSASFIGALVANGGIIKTGNVMIPCTASLGETRMRIVYGEQATVPASCGTVSWGEVEDYTVNIMDNPVAYTSSTAMQNAGVVAPNTADAQILRIPVVAGGCGVGTATDFYFNTTGTTNTSDITAAKLYSTGTSATFNTSKLLGTVSTPGATFSFTGLADTLFTNTGDTNNYWLAYDVASGATLSNVLDAGLDSINAVGAYRIPTVSAPAGTRQIDAPMTYTSSTATQANVSKVEINSTNNRIVGLEVVTSAIGSPINFTSIDISTNGTDSLPDIANLKVWYTGTSNVFATTTQFGSTVATPAATQTVTGAQPLANGTNYFWVTYDVTSGATIGHNVDGEITSMILAGVTQTPSVTAPAGVRQIRAPYCTASANNTSDEEIASVSFGSMTNSAACATLAPGAGSIADRYSNYTTLTPPVVQRGTAVPLSMTLVECGGGTYTSSVGVYIDYNADGDFTDAGELVYGSASFVGALVADGGIIKTGNVNIPCSASLGETRMRIVYGEQATVPASCGTVSWGEVEDYTISIADNPLVYGTTISTQVSSLVAPGTTDAQMMRVMVVAQGCTAGTVDELHFNTSGSTAAADIAAAKLYSTGTSSAFSTSTLLGTVASPSGAFSFTSLASPISGGPGDTNNFWLAYDISGSATLGNVVDATVDNVYAVGGFHTPAVTSPSGALTIQAPMTFVSSTVTQANVSKVETGSSNNVIIGYEVVTSATGSPINITALDVATTGTTSLTDITNLKVWYTGNSNAFNTTTQFGSTVATPAASQTVNGIQPLMNGTNYFWVTYDISGGATLANVVDAEVTSATIAALTQVPTVTAPAGTRQIRAPYCVAAHIAASACVTNVTFNTLNNSSLPGCTLPAFTSYPPTGSSTTTLIQGASYSFSVTLDGTTGATISLWIDFDGNGTFNTTEWFDVTRSSTGGTQTITVPIPATAATGSTKIRIRSRASTVNTAVDACTSFGSGESEDYEVTIIPLPPPTVYTWNVAGSGAYGTASNWTPTRTMPLFNDILVVNGGGSTTLTGVTSETIKSLYIANTTTANMNSSANLNVTDSLSLGAGSTLISGSSLALTLGSSATATGILDGTGHVEGALTRWIAAATGSYSFPMITAGNAREASINYTSAPSAGGTLTVRYVTGAPGTVGLPVVDGSLTLNNVDVTGIWRSTAASGLTGGTFDISANASNVPAVNVVNETALLGRASSGSPWLAVGTHVTTTGTTSALVLGRTGLTSYGDVGIAGTSSNPLPVVLTSFTAVGKSNDVLTSWTTASEINNKGFEVQRSLDGRNFETVGFVKGAGNSSTILNYSFTDAKAFAKGNVLYYRLKQVDYNNKSTYSQIVEVVKDAQKATSLAAHPNPFSNSYSVSFNAVSEGNVTIKMTDIQGRVVSQHSAKVTEGSNEILVNDLDQLRAGVYFVNVTVDGETQVLKLVKN